MAGLVAAPALCFGIVGAAPDDLDGEQVRLARAQRLELGRRHVAADQDVERHPVAFRGLGDRDAVVPGAGRHEATRWILLGDHRHGVRRATDLERTRRLHQLELQANLGRTTLRRQCRGCQQGRLQGDPSKAPARGDDIGQRGERMRGHAPECTALDGVS